MVLENARRKARAGLESVGKGVKASGEREGIAWVLGADTDVALDGRLLGKAGTEGEAEERLRALSGRTHEVLSGVVLLATGELLPHSGNKAPEVRERSGVARSHVTFRSLDEETLRLYLASGEWRGRAGAYAIQGLGSILIEELRGDFANVVGLPVGLLLELAPELLGALAGRR